MPIFDPAIFDPTIFDTGVVVPSVETIFATGNLAMTIDAIGNTTLKIVEASGAYTYVIDGIGISDTVEPEDE